MIKDGKELEYLVRQIEELLLPSGFAVTSNKKIYDTLGKQLAEFDVEIRGKLGSTDIAWLIECRDRPSEGAAPGSWIEQLVGRHQRFGFNKVTAVSTTGFADGAIEFAKQAGIELRSVEAISTNTIVQWMTMREITKYTRLTKLEEIRFLISSNESPDLVRALEDFIKIQHGNPRILRSTSTGQTVTCSDAYLVAASMESDPFEGLEANGLGSRKKLHVAYPNNADHFVIDTDAGPIRIVEIFFNGEFLLTTSVIPLSEIKQYSQNDGTKIAQSAIFPIEINEQQFLLELHNLSQTGETHVLLRKSNLAS